jgi:hypothetical protein
LTVETVETVLANEVTEIVETVEPTDPAAQLKSDFLAFLRDVIGENRESRDQVLASLGYAQSEPDVASIRDLRVDEHGLTFTLVDSIYVFRVHLQPKVEIV